MEKILKRPDGSRVVIFLRGDVGYDNPQEIRFRYRVYTIEKGKRKRIPVADTESFEYRRLDYKDRKKWVHDCNMQHITEDELHQAKIEFWEMLKPQP
jgi:hypothetical protein